MQSTSERKTKNAGSLSQDSLKYVQFAKMFRDQVRSGELKPGDQLPSYAQMQVEHGIGQGTIERVYALLEEEQLVVREPKRGTFVAEPRTRSSLGVIGLIAAATPQQHPYYSSLLRGIQEVTLQEGTEVLLLHESSAIKWEKMDGVLIAFARVKLPPSMPAVSLMHRIKGVHSVIADEYGAVQGLVEYLVGLGHRKVAFLTVPELGVVDPAEQRVQAYQDTLKSAGLKPRRRWVRALREMCDPVGKFVDLGYEKMRQWLEEDWHELGCTALIVHNDDAALGVLRACHEKGIRVPEDLSVVGFDGTEIAQHVRPALTTVALPLAEIGKCGMQSLLRQVQNSYSGHSSQSDESLLQVLPTELLVRNSTGAPPGRRR